MLLRRDRPAHRCGPEPDGPPRRHPRHRPSTAPGRASCTPADGGTADRWTGSPTGCPGEVLGGWLALLRDAARQYAAQPTSSSRAPTGDGQESDVRRVPWRSAPSGSRPAAPIASPGCGGDHGATLGYDTSRGRRSSGCPSTLGGLRRGERRPGAPAPDEGRRAGGRATLSVLEQIAVGLDSGSRSSRRGRTATVRPHHRRVERDRLVLTVLTWLVQLAARAFATLLRRRLTGAGGRTAQLRPS